MAAAVNAVADQPWLLLMPCAVGVHPCSLSADACKHIGVAAARNGVAVAVASPGSFRCVQWGCICAKC